MLVASWNVNSIRVRLPRLLGWLERRRPDVVCLQETKVLDEDFPRAEIDAAGYHSVITGQKTYNGVAILSRTEVADPILGMPGEGPDAERRIISAVSHGIRIVDIYAPNGQSVDSDKYSYKLDWFKRLRKHLDEAFTRTSDVLVCGDFNVAPEDRDVWDPKKWRGNIMFSEPEKAALNHVIEWGFLDALRLHRQEEGLYTWWDYRAGAFHRGWGLRIDHILISDSLRDRCTGVEIDRDERKGEKPSDHAPIVATFTD